MSRRKQARRSASRKRGCGSSPSSSPSFEVDRRDFVKIGIGALASLGLGETILLAPGETAAAETKPVQQVAPKTPHDYARAKRTPSVCLNCSTVCGIVGYVIDGRVVKLAGNPADPNNGQTICAKGQSGVSINVYPERLVYPLRRVGRRGEGLWKRVGWDEAYAELAERIGKCLGEGVPEQVAIHYGRSRISDVIERFMNAIGSPVILNHRALCSLNKRAANYASIGDADWETVDAERTKYLLNFGSNFYEAHQGHIHFLKRVIRGRFDNGAKLVTFDVRLSNTAGRSDEWLAPFPGTEGAVALAMARTMIDAGEFDAEFLTKWTNYRPDQLKRFLKPYTPAWAERTSGVAARDIERIALEFARCRPACAAFTNRGSHAHYNGLNNDRAVILLNALAGSIGQPGGYCYGEGERIDPLHFPPPEPSPPKLKTRTDLEDPPEYPLANLWQKMKVGELAYDYLQRKRALLQVYLTYTLGSPTTWPEGRSLAVAVLKDERLIPFHACSDVVYSETAHYADLILPDATYLERWGLDTRNSYEFRPYVALRQPLTPPPAECVSFADVLIQVARRLGGDAAKYFSFEDHEEYVRHQCRNVPPGDCADGFEYLKKHGVWIDPRRPLSRGAFARPLTRAQLEDAKTDDATGVISRAGANGKAEPIGVWVDGQALQGFKTPSRKFEILSSTVAEQSAKVGVEDDGLPHYVPVPAHENLPADRFVLTTFKWNVHTQARTAPQKYLSEIVHDNPLWINAATARRLGIRSGDLVEVTTYRPKGNTYRATGEKLGSARIRAFVTEGIHPRVLAASNSLGQLFGGRAATATNGPRSAGPGYDEQLVAEDPELESLVWWDRREHGRGAGYNLNAILPIQPAPVTGMQCWFDTVCSVRKV
ncbi:MAG TPA: molybdopterin-dependent oxidoreductase [Pirellulales bacterium]|nr:molybdopterin-dependent oxidoreductase [Pirellulales bacterium]